MSTDSSTYSARVLLAEGAGMHLRPAAMLVQIVSQYDADVIIRHNEKQANARSLLDIIMLCAKKGAWLTVLARGSDALKCIKAIRVFFGDMFEDGRAEAGELTGATKGLSRDIAYSAAKKGLGSTSRQAPREARRSGTSAGRKAAEKAPDDVKFPQAPFRTPPDKSEPSKEVASQKNKQRKKAHTFVLLVPNDTKVSDVKVAGNFANWTPLSMERLGDRFQAVVDLLPGTYEYKFIVNGQWQNDPSNHELVTSGVGSRNNVLRVA